MDVLGGMNNCIPTFLLLMDNERSQITKPGAGSSNYEVRPRALAISAEL